MFNNTFPKNFRLLNKNDFLSLREESRFFYHNSILIFLKNNSLKNMRIGIAASKKVGKSHDRNKYKRIIREYFRNSQVKYKPFDVLFVINHKKSSNENFLQILKKDLDISFKNISNL